MFSKIVKLIFGEATPEVTEFNVENNPSSFTTEEYTLEFAGHKVKCSNLTISKNAEYVDVRSDQSCTIQSRYLIKQDWTITTEFKNVSLDSLRTIYGLPEDSYVIPEFGSTEYQEPTEITLTGKGGKGYNRKMIFHQAICMPDNLEHTIVKDEPMSVRVEFTVLADSETGSIGKWIDTPTLFTRFKHAIIGKKT